MAKQRTGSSLARGTLGLAPQQLGMEVPSPRPHSQHQACLQLGLAEVTARGSEVSQGEAQWGGGMCADPSMYHPQAAGP